MKINLNKVKENINDINSRFEFFDLRYNVDKRVRVCAEDVGKGVLTYLLRNADCVQKIFHHRGAHSYYIYVPRGFIEYLERNCI